jgi:flavin-dependent dehydrogenase
MLIGDTAGFLNVPKIKGTHTAMKSGMVAADTVASALKAERPPVLEAYPCALRQSWVWQELHRVRNIPAGLRQVRAVRRARPRCPGYLCLARQAALDHEKS